MTSEQIETALDRIRPYLRSDGGNVELLEVAGNSVKIKLVGACHGCPGAPGFAAVALGSAFGLPFGAVIRAYGKELS